MKINANKNYLKTYCVPFGRSHLVSIAGKSIMRVK